jgi:hypothetical protein
MSHIQNHICEEESRQKLRRHLQEAEKLLETEMGQIETAICMKSQEGQENTPRHQLLSLKNRYKVLAGRQEAIHGDAMFERLFWQSFDRDEARYVVHLFEDPSFYESGEFGEEAELAAQSIIFKEGTLWRELQNSCESGSLTWGYKEVMEKLFPDSLIKYRQAAI